MIFTIMSLNIWFDLYLNIGIEQFINSFYNFQNMKKELTV